MVRRTHHFTDQQIRSLKEITERTGVGEPELVRRAVDRLIKEESGDRRPLESLKAGNNGEGQR